MTNPTSNFGWQMPTSTDLVTDLPADFETFGQAVDTSLADLKGGTTGQVLAKASNTDMDFTWASDASGIPATIFDAKGDLIAASAADTAARLAVGANDLVLTAASGETTGLKYTGGWVDWTPTFTNMTIGNGTLIARYQKIGKTVNWFLKFTFGSTSSFGAYTAFKLPIAPWSGQFVYNGRGLLRDAGTGWRFCSAIIENDDVYPNVENVAGTYSVDASVSSTIPFTWTTNDFLQLAGTYEVA